MRAALVSGGTQGPRAAAKNSSEEYLLGTPCTLTPARVHVHPNALLQPLTHSRSCVTRARIYAHACTHVLAIVRPEPYSDVGWRSRRTRPSRMSHVKLVLDGYSTGTRRVPDGYSTGTRQTGSLLAGKEYKDESDKNDVTKLSHAALPGSLFLNQVGAAWEGCQPCHGTGPMLSGKRTMPSDTTRRLDQPSVDRLSRYEG